MLAHDRNGSAQDCKCLFWIDMHSRTCNSWQYYDYVTANPSVLAHGCDNVLQRIQVGLRAVTR